MGEQKPLRERPKRERWFSKKQYEMLRRCSDKKDVTEWNEWQENHPGMPVFLEGAYLKDAHLEGAHFWDAHLERADFRRAHLEGTNFEDAHLEGAGFRMVAVDGGTPVP